MDNNFNECDTDLKTRHDADIAMLVGLQDWDLNMDIISGFDNHKLGVSMRDLLHLIFNCCEQKKYLFWGAATMAILVVSCYHCWIALASAAILQGRFD